MIRYIINEYQEEDKKVRLKPFRNDSEAFDKLIYGTTEDYIPKSNVTENYLFFYKKISEAQDITIDELYDALQKLEVIDIELTQGDNPQLIFESLNSTGLNLSEFDKTRNYVLMNLDPDTQEKFYDKYWSKIEQYCKDDPDSFVRNFLTIKTSQIPSLRRIYAGFKEYTAGADIEAILQDMLVYAGAYDRIRRFDLANKQINDAAKRLEKLDMTVAYPFLMAFGVYAQEQSLPTEEISRVYSCIETFIFRRLICGWATNALNKIFATLHKYVINHKTEDNSYADIVIYNLESRKASGAFPTDSEFIASFATRNIYSMKSKNKEYIFERLENGISKEARDVYSSLESGALTIEHIMPQTLNQSWKAELGENYELITDKWLHTIANLTLTGYNSTYSNKSFKEKKEMDNGFINSHLYLNKFIAKCDKWTENELEARSQHLAEEALKIWAYPNTSYQPPKREEDIASLLDDINAHTNRIIESFEFKGDKRSVISWADMMWQVANILYEINPIPLYEEASSKSNVWFTTKTSDPDYRKISEGLYFCNSKSSTTTKMSILKNLFSKYGLDEDELTFGLKPIEDEQ